jgi:hypothetical protein
MRPSLPGKLLSLATSTRSPRSGSTDSTDRSGNENSGLDEQQPPAVEDLGVADDEVGRVDAGRPRAAGVRTAAHVDLVDDAPPLVGVAGTVAVSPDARSGDCGDFPPSGNGTGARSPLRSASRTPFEIRGSGPTPKPGGDDHRNGALSCRGPLILAGPLPGLDPVATPVDHLHWREDEVTLEVSAR